MSTAKPSTSTYRLEMDSREVSVPIEAGISEHTPLIKASTGPVKNNSTDDVLIYSDNFLADSPSGQHSGYQQDATYQVSLNSPPLSPDTFLCLFRIYIYVYIFMSPIFLACMGNQRQFVCTLNLIQFLTFNLSLACFPHSYQILSFLLIKSHKLSNRGLISEEGKQGF